MSTEAKLTVRQIIAKHFTRKLESAEKILQKFKDGLNEDAAYQMMWADSAFRATAEITVAKQILHLIDDSTEQFNIMGDETLVQEIADILLRNVLNKAKNVDNKSTSVSSNFMHECLIASRSEAYDWVKSFVGLVGEFGNRD
jgi:hypothetical protein